MAKKKKKRQPKPTVPLTPCCQCCLNETNLTEHSWRTFVFWLCPNCEGAGYEEVEVYRGPDWDAPETLFTFVCPTHGDQKLNWQVRYFVGLAYYNRVKGTNKKGAAARNPSWCDGHLLCSSRGSRTSSKPAPPSERFARSTIGPPSAASRIRTVSWSL